jgi:predicted nucleotidyltransferase
MRLDKHTCQIIQEEVAKQFGIRAVVRLFGSRTDDLQRGGDIDLLIELDHLLDDRTKAYCQLSIQLGGRQVDVLIKDPSSLPSPIYTLALQTGIVL